MDHLGIREFFFMGYCTSATLLSSS